MGLWILAQSERGCLVDMLSPLCSSQPAPLTGHSAQQHAIPQFPRRDGESSWPCSLRWVESWLFWKAMLSQLTCFLKQMNFNCAVSLVSQFKNRAKRVAFRIPATFKVAGITRLQRGEWGLSSSHHTTPTPSAFQRLREIWLPHLVGAHVHI